MHILSLGVYKNGFPYLVLLSSRLPPGWKARPFSLLLILVHRSSDGVRSNPSLNMRMLIDSPVLECRGLEESASCWRSKASGKKTAFCCPLDLNEHLTFMLQGAALLQGSILPFTDDGLLLFNAWFFTCKSLPGCCHLGCDVRWLDWHFIVFAFFFCPAATLKVI